MRELTSPRMMWLKASLFLVLAVLSAAGLLMQTSTLSTSIFVLALAWAAARLYYFLFYVLQTWVDPTLRYSGILAMARELARRAME